MAKCLKGGMAGVMALAVALAGMSGLARAAGEWEWTQGQGWVQGAGVSRPTAKEQLAYAYQLEQRGEYMDAARQYFLLIQNFPEASESGVGLQRLAKCLFEMENYYTSFKAIEQVIRTYPNTGRMSDLVEIELRIAKKMLVSQASASVFEDGSTARAANTRRAIEIVDAVIDHDPYGPVAPEALLVKGEAHLYIGEISAARVSFDRILDEFSRSDFVERARLGILRCDSLLGQARPQEVYEQIQVVRETERERRRDADDLDEFDNVEASINQLAEVEAAKMMDQATQYRRMGTHNAVRSAEFLYKEVVRRYPETPQADEAREKLGTIKVPREQGRVTRAVRSVNLNPFTWNRDPEPPWIVPQLSPEDTVMVDSGIGPIAGVPETGFSGEYAAGVRPAALDRAASDAAPGPARFSPLDSAPGRDGGEYSSLAPGPAGRAPYAPAPGPIDLAPPQSAMTFPTTPNPLPAISESDLIGSPGMSSYYASAGTYAQPPMSPYPPAYPEPQPYQAAPTSYYDTGHPGSQPYQAAPVSMNLGPIPDASLSDLVGPAPRLESPVSYASPPPADYYAGQYVPAPDPYSAPYPEPSLSSGGYAPSPASVPVPYGNEVQHQGGGWTLGNDFY